MMQVKHGKTIIELEGDQERSYLSTAIYIAYQICNDAVRDENVPPVLVRAGIEPADVMAVGHLAHFVDKLNGML